MSSRRHRSSRHSSNRLNDEPIAGPSNEASNQVSHWPPERYIDPETFSDSITNRPGGITENDPIGTGYDTIYNDPRFYPAREAHMQESTQQASASERPFGQSEYFTDNRQIQGYIDSQQPVTYQPPYVSIEESQAGFDRMRANLQRQNAEARNAQASAPMQQGYYLSENPPAEASGSGPGVVTNDPNAWYCNDCGKALTWCHLLCNSCDKRPGPRPDDRNCIKCAAPTEEQAVLCPGHMNAFRGLLNEDQKKRLGEDGACKECYRYERPESGSKCSKCREKHATLSRTSAKRVLDRRNNAGLCGSCKGEFTQNDINMHPAGKPKNCQKCIKKINAKDKKVRENRKRR